MKKFLRILGLILSIILAIIIIIVIIALNSDTPSDNVEETTSESQIEKTVTPENTIENAIRQRITDEFDDIDIDDININADLGTKKVKNDYIALVHLTCTLKKFLYTPEKTLSILSETLAIYVGKDCPNVQEIVFFWEVPSLNDAHAKFSYERKGNKMYEMDRA